MSYPVTGGQGGAVGRPEELAEHLVELVGRSPLARAVRQAVWRAAAGERPVLVVAEPGVDAEGVARLIHRTGRRAAAPFVAVDCATPDPAALEAALFGSLAPRRGTDRPAARTGGLERVGVKGCLSAARGGTLLLANAVDLPASAQGRLARLLRDGELIVEPRKRPDRFDVRLVATAPPTIDAEVQDGRFRPDLFRRLAAERIDLPPLRRRGEDLPLIVERLVEEGCRAVGAAPKHLTQAALALLAALPWRGNLEELRGVVARLVASVEGETVQVEHVLAHVPWPGGSVAIRPNGTLREARRQFEREYVAAVLERHAWRMSEAARELGIQRPNLYRKVRQLGLLRVGLPRGRSKG